MMYYYLFDCIVAVVDLAGTLFLLNFMLSRHV